MEDRYLFKAKRVDNGEWVQGALLDGESHCIIGQEIKFSPYVEHECKIVGYEVDRNTICQCIGRKDKNNTLIWENDTVKVKYSDGYEEVADVYYEGSKYFPFSNEYGCEDCNSFCLISEIEVIGNVFDNTDL